jgi:hypothetical protein
VGTVFISYRRDDSGGYAGRVYDRLAARLGRERVVMDVDSMQLGVDFVDQINRFVSGCQVMLAIIGPDWAGKQPSGERRIDSDTDYVRLEVEAALARGVPVIPLLVQDAEIPRTEDLPASLQPLVRRHGEKLRHERFHADVEDLVDAVQRLLVSSGERGSTAGPQPTGGVLPEERGPSNRWTKPRDEMQHAADLPAPPDGYRIESLLREGKIGNVYRAVQVGLERPVALQIVSGLHAADPASRQRFLTEHRVVAAITHPGLVPIYDLGEYAGGLFVATQLVEGRLLHRIQRELGKLPAGRAGDLLAQVADALAATHEAGIAHHDVNLINVIVADKNGTEHAYVTGFAPRITPMGTGLTIGGALLPTTAYMAPELIRGEQSDGRADIYSLGCVLFHLLTGRLPFERDSAMAMMWAHVSDTPPSVRELAPEVPDSHEELIRVAMEKDPAARFQTAAGFSDALRAARPPRSKS